MNEFLYVAALPCSKSNTQSDCYQVGIPSDRDQYIHRLGRTGREGKEGQGILLLAPWEEYFLDELKDLPVEKFPTLRLDPGTKLKVLASPPILFFVFVSEFWIALLSSDTISGHMGKNKI